MGVHKAHPTVPGSEGPCLPTTQDQLHPGPALRGQTQLQHPGHIIHWELVAAVSLVVSISVSQVEFESTAI